MANEHGNLVVTKHQEAARLDAADPLAEYRQQFHLPVNWVGEPVIYFCGNSLGLQPLRAIEYVERELRMWREVAVDGYSTGTHPWMPYHEFVTKPLARIGGALPEEIVPMNSLTVNLHLMLVSFFRPTSDRYRIVMESKAFPSDRYAIASHLAYRGLDPVHDLVELEPRAEEHTLRTEDIVDFLDREGSSVALVMIGGVNYYTGQLFDLETITEAGHRNGCLVGFDLAHAAGNVPLRLHDWDVDFAVWCTYKYLNSGPGAAGVAFVHERHVADPSIQRFAGWWGHDKASRFDMPPEHQPIPTAEGWLLSNSPVFTLAALRSSLEIFDEVGMDAIRRKSIELTGYLESELLAIENRPFEIITPANPDDRGAQLSLLFRERAKEVFERLKATDVVCDYREPNVIRVAPAPLYNTFGEVQRFADLVRQEI